MLILTRFSNNCNLLYCLKKKKKKVPSRSFLLLLITKYSNMFKQIMQRIIYCSTLMCTIVFLPQVISPMASLKGIICHIIRGWYVTIAALLAVCAIYILVLNKAENAELSHHLSKKIFYVSASIDIFASLYMSNTNQRPRLILRLVGGTIGCEIRDIKWASILSYLVLD